MAKRTCPHCRKKDVHHKATVCPYCQKSIQPVSFWKTRFGIFLIIVGGLWVLGAISSQFNSSPSNISEKKSQAVLDKAKAAREKAQERLRKEFANKKSTIVAGLEDLYRAGRYDEVQKKATPYLFIKDADLQSIVTKSREKELLADVKKIPSANLEANKELYAKLVSLNPKEEQYKKKLAYFEGKIQKKGKEHQARIALFGNPPERGGWTGTYYIPVKRSLELAAHDPGSIEFEGCTEVYQTDEGWLVGCVYRGKNAFGALVKNANWFVIRHDQVVDMKPSSAYKW